MTRGERRDPTADATMAEWVQRLRSLSSGHEEFAKELLREEQGKVERLARMANDTGLPIYESFRFCLPSQREAFERVCRRITSTPAWRLAVRISRSRTSDVLFRSLGVSANQAMAMIKELPKDDTCTAIVSAYKLPERSGSLRIVNGQAEMDFVFGPHTVISKGGPAGIELFHCCNDPFTRSVKYSTRDERIRAILFTTFRDAIRLVLGCSLKEATDWERTVYAEFHWHKDVGYRFIECTYSDVWTG